MKKTAIGLIGLLIITYSYGQSQTKEVRQEKREEVSHVHTFSAKAGRLIKKEFIEVGEIKKAKIRVIQYTDLITSESVSAVSFKFEVTGSYSTDVKMASLDADEIEGLIKSIEIIREKIFLSIPVNYTEVKYRSRDGFEAGCFWSKGEWATYLQLDQYDGDSYIFLKKDDFPALLTLLRKSKSILN